MKPLAFIVMAALAASAHAASDPNRGSSAVAQYMVRAILKDPQSAQFGPTYSYGAGGVVCGTVNAKNSFGGYTGPRAFIAFTHNPEAPALIVAPKLSKENAALIKKECGL